MGILGSGAITRVASITSGTGFMYSGRMYFFTYNSPCRYSKSSVISSPTGCKPVTSSVGARIISSLRRWAGSGLRPGWLTRTTVCFISCAFTCLLFSTATSASLSFSNKVLCCSLLLAVSLNFSWRPLKINFCNSISWSWSKFIFWDWSSFTSCCFCCVVRWWAMLIW